MSLIYIAAIVITALVSFAIAWLLSRQSGLTLVSKLEVSKLEVSKLEAQVTQSNNEQRQLMEQLNDQKLKAGRLEAMLMAERTRFSEKEQALLKKNQDIESERHQRTEAEIQVRELETRLEEQQKQNQQIIKQMTENKVTLKQEFSHLANDIFEARGKAFSEQSKERLEALLLPFKEQLGDFRTRVDTAHKEDIAGRAALKQQLENLHQLNQKITDEAGNLAKALKGDKKLQGNWGELQVEKILESSGLVKGQEYQREANFKDEEGQNKRPDFVVYLPEGKHLIIDSKVSLVDYMAHVNADTDSEREASLNRHIQSIRNHIKSLNEKDYPSLPEMKAPDFVFMFMPIEPAFITAFQHDQQLFNEAFEKRIVVVTPTTLLATLRTVANLWTIERQNANARKLADRARQVYDKLRIFAEKMEKLDTQLVNARSTYDEAMGTLKHGRGNLISQADQFLNLGVRVKKEIPRHTLETADLTKEHLPELPEKDKKE